MQTPLFLALAYLLGSLPFAVIVSRAFGLSDPRSYGSGNPGATNVLRSGNKAAAALTLLGDAVKGAAAVLLVRALLTHHSAAEQIVALAGLLAFLGHVFSVFLRFRGGKGVATAAGVLLAMNPAVGGMTLAVWVGIVALTRYSSAAALTAALAAPVFTAWQVGDSAWIAAVSIMSAILIWRHRDNIRRLFSGQEGRIGAKKP